jgi:hypothetical protein
MLPAAGAALLALALVLLFANERGVLAYRQAAERHGGSVLDLGTEAYPDSDQYGHMVRVAGTPEVVEPPRDADFGVSADTPLLVRKVQMFQWREVRVGTGVNYEMDWVDHAVDTSRFERPQGHANPGPFPFRGARFVAPNVRLAHYHLDPAIVRALPGVGAPIRADLSRLPPNLAASFQIVDGRLSTSADPGSPQLGDLRVSWEAVPLQLVTVIARVDGRSLKPAVGAADGRGFEVQVGDRALRDVLPDLPPVPGAVWTWRVLALLIAWGGAVLLLRELRRRPDVLAALGLAVVPLALLAAVIWIGTSITAGLMLLALALLAGAGTIWRRRGRRA